MQVIIGNIIKQDAEIIIPELIETIFFSHEEYAVYNTKLIDQLNSFFK